MSLHKKFGCDFEEYQGKFEVQGARKYGTDSSQDNCYSQ